MSDAPASSEGDGEVVSGLPHEIASASAKIIPNGY